jgi:hypothetical protein
MPILELSPKAEVVTTIFRTETADGATWDAPVAFGYYPGNRDEVFVQSEEWLYNIQCSDVDEFCRALKRAKKLAMEQPKEEAP